jgi:hypothetical protein
LRSDSASPQTATAAGRDPDERQTLYHGLLMEVMLPQATVDKFRNIMMKTESGNRE